MVLSKHKEVCPGFKILSLDCQQSLDGIQGNFKSPIQLILWFGFPREQNQGDSRRVASTKDLMVVSIEVEIFLEEPGNHPKL